MSKPIGTVMVGGLGKTFYASLVGFLVGAALAGVLYFAYQPEPPTVEETCAEYTIKWESYERETKNIDFPAPGRLIQTVYDRCIDILSYESAPFEDANAPKVLGGGGTPDGL